MPFKPDLFNTRKAEKAAELFYLYNLHQSLQKISEITKALELLASGTEYEASLELQEATNKLEQNLTTRHENTSETTKALDLLVSGAEYEASSNLLEAINKLEQDLKTGSSYNSRVFATKTQSPTADKPEETKEREHISTPAR